MLTFIKVTTSHLPKWNKFIIYNLQNEAFKKRENVRLSKLLNTTTDFEAKCNGMLKSYNLRPKKKIS